MPPPEHGLKDQQSLSQVKQHSLEKPVGAQLECSSKEAHVGPFGHGLITRRQATKFKLIPL